MCVQGFLACIESEEEENDKDGAEESEDDHAHHQVHYRVWPFYLVGRAGVNVWTGSVHQEASSPAQVPARQLQGKHVMCDSCRLIEGIPPPQCCPLYSSPPQDLTQQSISCLLHQFPQLTTCCYSSMHYHYYLWVDQEI